MSLLYAMTNVLSSISSNQVIGILKGNWSLRQRQRLPLCNSYFAVTPKQLSILWGEMSIKQRTGLHPWGINEPKAKGPDFVFGIILTHLFHGQRGRKHFEGSNDSVFGDSCQKGGEMSPKQKDRTTTYFKFQKLSIEYFPFGILLCSKGGESSISK
jgi:hypothetical protein